MKILCLHGMGTNSKIFKAQTAGIRNLLSQHHSIVFDFVEGAVDSPPDPGIASLCPNEMEFFSYYDYTKPATVTQAVDDLSAYIKSEGPFNGVMAFSQGSALAAMLLARQTFPSPFALAIFICGGPPLSEAAINKGEPLRYLDVALDGENAVLKLITVHIIGSKDDTLGNSMKLLDLCEEKSRIVYDHGAGHEIPAAPRITEEIVKHIELGIGRASFAQ